MQKMKANYHGCIFVALQWQYDKGAHGTGAGDQIGGAHVHQSRSVGMGAFGMDIAFMTLLWLTVFTGFWQITLSVVMMRNR